MGHVGIQPEHVGLVAADDRTRAKHQFKFRAVGSNRRRLELASVPCGGTVNRSTINTKTGYDDDDCKRYRATGSHRATWPDSMWT